MIHAFTHTPMDRMLSSLSAILAKAEEHVRVRNLRPETLLAFRLFPDMFDLTRQVQLTCDFACRAAARLAGAEPRPFPDTETSFAELQARIAAARAYIAGFDAATYADAAARSVTIKVRGDDMTLPGAQYLSLYVLPQFYFHATTAYNILRHNGVDLGKRDFMAG